MTKFVSCSRIKVDYVSCMISKDVCIQFTSYNIYKAFLSIGINKRVQSAPSSHDHHHIGALIKKGSALKIKK